MIADFHRVKRRGHRLPPALEPRSESICVLTGCYRSTIAKVVGALAMRVTAVSVNRPKGEQTAGLSVAGLAASPNHEIVTIKYIQSYTY